MGIQWPRFSIPPSTRPPTTPSAVPVSPTRIPCARKIRRIDACRRPIARRMPISRVLSRTTIVKVPTTLNAATTQMRNTTNDIASFSALKLEKLAMSFVVFLICVVAAFNVVGTLTMVVRDKTREIGILLAMGLRQASIRRIFLAQGILVGLTGTALGVVGGLVLGGMLNRGHWIPIDPSIYFIDHLPVQTQPLDVLLVIGASLVVATLAPLYPSMQAARLDPVTAIRYE